MTSYSFTPSILTWTENTFAPPLSWGDASRKRRNISEGGLLIVTPFKGLEVRVKS